MTDFMFVAALYYACDQAALEARLSASDIIRCSLVYETVKVQFLSEEEQKSLATLDIRDRTAVMQTAYRRFRAWEEDNPDLVESLRTRGLPAAY